MADKNVVEKYIDLLKKGCNENLIDFKKSFLPKSLFKYRPLCEYTLNCLEHDSVWVSAAEIQNDPFESALFFNDKEFALSIYTSSTFKGDFINTYGKEITDIEIKDIVTNQNPEKKFREICKKKGIERIYDDFGGLRESLASSYISKIKRKIMLSSFSERMDSILMWSHYSDKHKGICIEYDFSEESYILNFLEPINYSDKLISLSKAFGKKDFNEIARIAAITKAKDWKYEKEWRIVFPSKLSGHFKVPLPKAIYLGARFHENNKEKNGLITRLTKKCNDFSIPLIPMKVHESQYKIIKKGNA